MIRFTDIKDFMRYVNNAQEAIIIRGTRVYNEDKELIAEYNKPLNK